MLDGATQQQKFEQEVNAQIIVGLQQEPTDPLVCSLWNDEIAVPPRSSAFVEWLLTPSVTGKVHWLSRYGERLVALMPADVAVSLLNQPLEGLVGTVAGRWAAWQRETHGGPYGSLFQRGIAAGEIRPPSEWGMPALIPELADLPSLTDSIIAARERERDR
jgi:hypothetical protein